MPDISLWWVFHSNPVLVGTHPAAAVMATIAKRQHVLSLSGASLASQCMQAVPGGNKVHAGVNADIRSDTGHIKVDVSKAVKKPPKPNSMYFQCAVLA